MRTCTCNFDEVHVVLVTNIKRGEREGLCLLQCLTGYAVIYYFLYTDVVLQLTDRPYLVIIEVRLVSPLAVRYLTTLNCRGHVTH